MTSTEGNEEKRQSKAALKPNKACGKIIKKFSLQPQTNTSTSGLRAPGHANYKDQCHVLCPSEGLMSLLSFCQAKDC